MTIINSNQTPLNEETILVNNQEIVIGEIPIFNRDTKEIFEKTGSNVPDLNMKINKKAKKLVCLVKALKDAEKNPIRDKTIGIISNLLQLSLIVAVVALGILLMAGGVACLASLSPLILALGIVILGTVPVFVVGVPPLICIVLSMINVEFYHRSQLSFNFSNKKNVDMFPFFNPLLPIFEGFGKIQRLKEKIGRYQKKIEAAFSSYSTFFQNSENLQMNLLNKVNANTRYINTKTDMLLLNQNNITLKVQSKYETEIADAKTEIKRFDLACKDLNRGIEFYSRFTPMKAEPKLENAA